MQNLKHRMTGRGVIAALICAAAGIVTMTSAGAAELALQRVMLSSGGMGYFEYRASVTGRDSLALRVPLDQVDDVLKSVVILDSRGGSGSIRMPGREPLRQVFRELPFRRGDLNSPAAILNALQGAEVAVGGASAVRGRLLRAVAETVKLTGGIGSTKRHRVSVMTAQGLRTFILEEAESISFVSPKIQKQVNDALAAIARHRTRDRRTLRIEVSGTGAGTVTVGYVISVPLWKTTYRVSLPRRQSKDKARFQGWALIDNMSGQDWKNVELTLLSGSPVSFRQALYSAYFVKRPLVPVEVIGRVLPRVDTGLVAAKPLPPRAAAPRRTRYSRRAELSRRSVAKSMRLRAGRARARTAASTPVPTAVPPPPKATAQQAATQVAFRIPNRISAINGQSLMVPIIDRRMDVERISLFQSATHRLHPLATVRLANSGATGMPPGVLTLYDQTKKGASQYVGDAQIGVLPAGENRLVSYALDLRTRMTREQNQKKRIAKGRVSRGVLELSLVDSQTTVYRIKAPAREDRRIVIEHPRRTGWTLAAAPAQQAKSTPTHYRLGRKFKAGSEGVVEVTLERKRLERIQLLSISRAALAGYAKNGELDPAIRKSFARMGELWTAIDRVKRQLADLEKARKRIFEEQKRIRNNMNRVRSKTDLHRRYVAKLDSQETELEKLEARYDSSRKAVREAEEELGTYVSSLNL